MTENEPPERGVLKRDVKRASNHLVKPMTAAEFLAWSTRSQNEIKQEFRKMANPEAKDPHAAK